MEPSLRKRLLTSVIGVPLVILTLLSPNTVITVVVILASLVGLYEYYKAVDLLKNKVLCLAGYLASIVISTGASFSTPVNLVLVFTFIIALFIIMLFSNQRISLSHIGLLVVGLIYIPFFLSHISYVRALPYGNFYIWLIFIGAFLTDTCAYFVGCNLGKNKLCPAISPKKTVEGAIGGILGGGLSFVLFGIIVNLFFGKFLDGKHFSLLLLFVLGFLSAVVSEIGDLVASAIKRQYGIKDFGNLLPGHGGILDRCDSILFVAPIIFLFLSLVNILA